INIIVSIPLAKIYGGFGTAFITAITMIIGHIIIMNIYYQKRVGINIVKFWKNIMQLTVPNVIITTITYYILIFIVISIIIECFFYFLLFSLLYLISLLFTAMNKYEKILIIFIFYKIK